MYNGAGGAGHGGLLVADGKRPVTVYEHNFTSETYTMQPNQRGVKNTQFSANKSLYLRNGAR